MTHNELLHPRSDTGDCTFDFKTFTKPEIVVAGDLTADTYVSRYLDLISAAHSAGTDMYSMCTDSGWNAAESDKSGIRFAAIDVSKDVTELVSPILVENSERRQMVVHLEKVAKAYDVDVSQIPEPAPERTSPVPYPERFTAVITEAMAAGRADCENGTGTYERNLNAKEFAVRAVADDVHELVESLKEDGRETRLRAEDLLAAIREHPKYCGRIRDHVTAVVDRLRQMPAGS